MAKKETLREELTKEILSFFDDLDPSGANTERMRKVLSSFKTDEEFYEFMKDFFEDTRKNWQVAYKPYDNNVNMEFIESVAKKHGIPIYEIVYMPYLSPDPSDPVGTVHPVMVLDYPIKRLKQMVYKKSHTSTSATKRSSETGQVINEDKTARLTSPEVYSLIVQNQYSAAKEFFSLRSDNLKAQNDAQRIIIRDGELSLKDIDTSPANSVTANTLQKYMYGACLITNLASDNPYLLPYTIKHGYNTKEIERGNRNE